MAPDCQQKEVNCNGIRYVKVLSLWLESTLKRTLVVTISEKRVVQIQQNFMKSLPGAGPELGAIYFPWWPTKGVGAYSLALPTSSTITSIPKASLVIMQPKLTVKLKFPQLPPELEYTKDTLTHFSLFPALRPPGGYP